MNQSPRSLRERQRAQTRAEIIRVAFDLFSRHGYTEVSVETIAAEAGVSRATFFNYFPQKDLLLREVASARIARLQAILAEARTASASPTLAGIVEIVLTLTRENARISMNAKQLLLATIFGAASRGFLLTAPLLQRRMFKKTGIQFRFIGHFRIIVQQLLQFPQFLQACFT